MTKPVKRSAAKATKKRAASKTRASSKERPTPAKRAYSSAVRQEQAANTRQRILDAAGRLFLADGYARTTVAGIAAEADVAADTIYKTFGSKARVLTALIDQRLSPAAGTPSMLDRPEAAAVRDEPDPCRQIHLFAHDLAAISTRVRPVYEILRTASAVEPDMAAIHAEMDSYRLRNMRQTASWIAGNARLRVDEERAAEIIWTVASPDVGRLLCDQRGWTEDEFADWLEDTLVRTLLPDEPAG